MSSSPNIRPYHRQLEGEPTIVVRNGFLDNTVKHPAHMPRTASAPAGLRSRSGSLEMDLEGDEEDHATRRLSMPVQAEHRESTDGCVSPARKASHSTGPACGESDDAASDSTCSFSGFGESKRGSPVLGVSSASPLLQAVAKQVAQTQRSQVPHSPGVIGSGAVASSSTAAPSTGMAPVLHPWDTSDDFMLPETAIDFDDDEALYGGKVEIEMHIEEGGPAQPQAAMAEQAVRKPVLAPPAGIWLPNNNGSSHHKAKQQQQNKSSGSGNNNNNGSNSNNNNNNNNNNSNNNNNNGNTIQISSPTLSCHSPVWSYQGSPLLMAQVSPFASPQLVPQGAFIPAPWVPPQAWQMAPVSQCSSPLQSPQVSPSLSPQLAPTLNGMPMSPQMAPQKDGPVPELCLNALASDTSLGRPKDPLQPHTIWQCVSDTSGVHRVIWTIDAGKLKNQERQAVSPSFDLPVGHGATARLVIFPRPNSDGKGSASFKKSNGTGTIQLKCEAASGAVSFLIGISDGTPDFNLKPRGPVTHNFSSHSTCGLPKDQEIWDFNKAVNQATQTFCVCLDILKSA